MTQNPNIAYINNQPHAFVEGETILEFAKRVTGVDDFIPTLCDAPGLETYGACRVCSVEVANAPGAPARVVASCHTLVSRGQHITTHSGKIRKLRKNIIELVLTDHPLECLVCEVNGNCELQTVAAKTGITEVRYPEGKTHSHLEKDLSHPYMTSDLSKCILCYRCVRACDEIQGQFVLSAKGRGFDTQIIKGMDQSFFDSDCVSCGACAQACPTSAISDVFQSKSIANRGEVTRTICTYCGVGCNLEVHTQDNTILSIRAPYDAEVNAGHTCLKGRYAFSFYNHPDRIRHPLIKKNGVFQRVSWEEAYDFIAEKLQYIKATYGPDAIGGVSSSRCTNEENYLMQKFMRAVVGTNNIDGCARVCHAPTAYAMQQTFGTGAATNSVADLEDTSCILVVGANPVEAHPVTGAKIKQRMMKGVPSIVIDPRSTTLAKYATYHLQLRPGTNVALMNMMMYFIITEGWADMDFLQRRCEGYEMFVEQLKQLDVDEMERVTGVPQALVREAAKCYATADAAMSFHGLGVTEHYQGSYGVMQIADLAMLTGNIGKRGAGVNPLRGQNNVQGAADMGVQPHQGAGYLDVTHPEIQQKYHQFYGVPVPQHVGLKIPEMIDAAFDERLKAMWIIGEDVVQTDPNTQHIIRSLEKLDLLIVQELFMTETARYADVILPGASFLEKEGTFTNGERRIQRVNKVVEPVGEAKADGQIIIDMMNKMGYQQPGPYRADVMLEEISRIVPFFAGVTWERLSTNGLQWPVAEDGTDTKILHSTEFKRGLGRLLYHDYEDSPEVTTHAEKFPYILTTNRVLEHYNCGAMTRRTGNEQIVGEDLLLIHPEDAAKNGIKDGAFVCVESPRGKVDIKAHITTDVNPGVLSSTFHFPDIMINNITGDVADKETMCPEYKVVSVRIRKSRKLVERGVR